MAVAGIKAEIDAAHVRFVANASGLVALLQSESSPVARDLVKRAIRVESAAKLNASQPPPSVPGHGPAVRTGRLRGSITWRLGRDLRGLYADIGSAVLSAPYVELGTSRMEARPFLRPALIAAE
jgi:hypothetical protein